ncbi:MAG: prepilin-type N-terminal cleavage/methylation domain-containing protein [Clostridia bacterium]|nr:prepilin-type N-terminal cleavage/methylation domain-containing protein [Clostridia bacterium]
MDRKRRGFTLMEMLIVVAIIGILVAVAIPVFSTQLEKTRAAVCMANRRSLQSVLTTSYTAAPASITLGADNSTIDVSSYKDDYVCPSGGTISARLNKDGIAVIACSKHTGGSFADQQTLDTLKKDIDEAIGGRSKLDSGASGTDDSATKALLAKLAADGIDLNAMGAESWRYVPGKNAASSILYWSMQDISSMSIGQKVLTMRYNFNTGTYCVSEATIKTDSVDATSAVYNVLDGENLNAYKKVYPDAKDQTYENALAYYLANYQK